MSHHINKEPLFVCAALKEYVFLSKTVSAQPGKKALCM